MPGGFFVPGGRRRRYVPQRPAGDPAVFHLRPRASYVACAVTEFVSQLDDQSAMEVFYKETNAHRAINNIVNADYKLGILRYQSTYEQYFHDMLEEKGLAAETIAQFQYVLVMARSILWPSRRRFACRISSPMSRFAHADPFVPSLPLSTVRKNELLDDVDKHVFVFERGSLNGSASPDQKAFMWVSPIPSETAGSVRPGAAALSGERETYQDVLIYKKEYAFTDLDRQFIETLKRVKEQTWHTRTKNIIGIKILKRGIDAAARYKLGYRAWPAPRPWSWQRQLMGFAPRSRPLVKKAQSNLDWAFFIKRPEKKPSFRAFLRIVLSVMLQTPPARRHHPSALGGRGLPSLALVECIQHRGHLTPLASKTSTVTPGKFSPDPTTLALSGLLVSKEQSETMNSSGRFIS